MADEDITLDGKPLQSLRVADLKAALEQRNLPKSGQKNALIKRLKGALMLENLQKSSSHGGLQPNSQIGEEMSQNSFIQQYLAKQQELLRQKMEREAQQDDNTAGIPAAPGENEGPPEDHTSLAYVSDNDQHTIQPQLLMSRAEEKIGDTVISHGKSEASLHSQDAAAMQRAAFQPGHKDPPAPSPPRAIASLSVRVLGQPDRQGLPPITPRTHEKEGAAPSEPGSAHSVLHLSRSAGGLPAGGRAKEDSDEDDSANDNESEDNEEDWEPGPAGPRRDNKAHPQPKVPLGVPSTFARSKRKLQPPQHIPPPPPPHHSPMQLRHPTPPPSPPSGLFPLPDTPKQSPPDTGDSEDEDPEAHAQRMAPFPAPAMQRQDSNSSSRSSSPEPPVKRRPGPLSLLVHKMESEKACRESEACSVTDSSGGTVHPDAKPGCSIKSPQRMVERKTPQDVAEERPLKEKKDQEQDPEKKCEEEENERERKRQEEGKLQQNEEKIRKYQEKMEERQGLKVEKFPQRETHSKDKEASESQETDSSSDSDSKSDSSSHSSQTSSSSSGNKSHPARHLKKSSQLQGEDRKTTLEKEADKPYLSQREVSEPSTAVVTEVEAESESPEAQQPPPGAEPEKSEGHLEEGTIPKAFASRKISLTSNKTPPATTDGGASEPDAGSAAGRKRRWGSSTSVTAKKPSISITTDSLKSLIPDIKVNQEAVVELHPEELQLSAEEDDSDGDHDKGLKIRRTVTQVVPSDGQENGQKNNEEEVEVAEKDEQHRTPGESRRDSVGEEAAEPQPAVSDDRETAKKVAPSDTVVRRSFSQQSSSVSVTIDDPIRTTRQLSPPHGKVSNIIHVTNLVRPFTLGQLKELLSRTGNLVEEGFWIDKIKSHCYVTYSTTEEATATRAALHRVKWPLSNPKVLSVDFSEQDELDFHKGIIKADKEKEAAPPAAGPPSRLPPLMPEQNRDRERDRDRGRDKDKERERERERERGAGGVRDLWAEREREMQRRERARGEREWDRDKVREFARPDEEGRRSRSRERERRRRERAKSKERKADKKEKDEPPAKLLDDLFLKTKAAPCIYWLPHTEEQANQRLVERSERQKERERRHKEQQEEEDKKREEEKKERLKGREKDGGSAAVGTNRGPDGDRERERDRDRDRERDRETEKRRDSSHRPSRTSTGGPGGRRSRSRSNPRDRRH